MTENRNNPNRFPEHDAELTALHARLKREMPTEPPAGLATDIFRATVSELPERPVVARLGWTSWAGWRYAAAVGLIFFFAALWTRPHQSTDSADNAVPVAAIEQAIQPPAESLDQDIDALAAEVTAYADSFDPAGDFAWVEDDDDPLTRDMLELEQQLNTEMF